MDVEDVVSRVESKLDEARKEALSCIAVLHEQAERISEEMNDYYLDNNLYVEFTCKLDYGVHVWLEFGDCINYSGYHSDDPIDELQEKYKELKSILESIGRLGSAAGLNVSIDLCSGGTDLNYKDCPDWHSSSFDC